MYSGACRVHRVRSRGSIVFGAWGLGFRVWGLGFRASGLVGFMGSFGSTKRDDGLFQLGWMGHGLGATQFRA